MQNTQQKKDGQSGGLNGMPTVQSLGTTSANSGLTIGPPLSSNTKQMITGESNEATIQQPRDGSFIAGTPSKKKR